jgi:transketolase
VESTELARRIRKHALRMTSGGGSSHIGAVFSMADLVAVLYAEVMNVDPKNPRWAERDRFILSKGHAGAGIYAALAECGFFPLEKLDTHYRDGSLLSGHVSHKGIPGVEFSTGSLGHGLPVGAGMAYGASLDGAAHRVFVVLSDGECDEGSNWEAILFAAHHKLRNLVAIVDYNKIQSLAKVEDTIALEPFVDKWVSFGWEVREVDGHDHVQLRQVLSTPSQSRKPVCVIAHTIKGKGVSFMEGTVLWHYRTARGEEYDRALQELERS